MSGSNQLAVIYKDLDMSLDKQVAALPKEFNKQRFLQNCMTVLQEDKEGKIAKCDPKTVVRTLIKGAFLGLDFFNRECYAIPYGGSVNFQTDYKGEIKLCKKYSINPIRDIYAKVVREGDFFEESIVDGRQSINFRPVPFSNKEILGAFAVVYFAEGSMMYDTMSVEEIESTRKNYSKMPDGQAWKNSTSEMYKKTVLRRLCKMVELDFESVEQRKVFDDSSDFDMDKKPEMEEATSPLIVEVEAVEVEVVEGDFDQRELS